MHKQEGQQKLGNFTQFSVLVIEITNVGRLEVIQLLLSHGAEVNAGGNDSMAIPCRPQRVETIYR